MTAFLPPNLLALFAPRDPIPYLPPVDKLCHEKKKPTVIGVAQFLKEFEDPKDTPPPTRVETKEERKERKKKERNEQIAYKLEQDLALWNPAEDPESTSDPFKTLFVARINFDTSESKLRREFEVYGSIRKIRQVHDSRNTKVRGFAFIEYEHERDMHSAYKHADGKKIDGRRVLVDVERGRTVKGWRPRRLGGGLGGTRKGGPEENTRFSGRDEFSGAGGVGGFGRDERGRERSRSREREPRDRDIRRRSRSRERKRRSRSRSPRRRRSRERRRSRDRGGDRGGDRGDRAEEEGEEESRARKRSRRSRSRDRTKRSKSRERKSRRRSRSRERRERRPEDGGDAPPPEPNAGDNGAPFPAVQIKVEKEVEGYGIYPGPEATKEALNGVELKEEPDDNQFEEQYGDY